MKYKLKIFFYEKEDDLLYEIYHTDEDVRDQFTNDELFITFTGKAEATKDGVEFQAISKDAIKKFSQIETIYAEN